MNFSDPRFLLDLAQTLVIVILWLRKPGQDAAAAVTALATRMDDELHALATKQTEIEERIRHMPTSTELAELEGTVRAIDARTEGMSDRISQMGTTLNRIESYLLNQK